MRPPPHYGVRPEGRVDGRARRWSWSWACRCGEWNDTLRTRKDAREEYRDHKSDCPWHVERRRRARARARRPRGRVEVAAAPGIGWRRVLRKIATGDLTADERYELIEAMDSVGWLGGEPWEPDEPEEER